VNEIDPELGLRRLSATNWLERDPTGQGAGYMSELVGPVVPDADGWARKFLAVELDAEVPHEVRGLFAVARGCMPYGWFFYPLYRFGEEQLFRVLDAAAHHCYGQLGGPEPVPRYIRRIDWLVAEGVIPAGDGPRWQAARELRNISSHAVERSAMPPGAVLGQLEMAAWDINAIFRRARHRRDP
jgi:hypothetical protein